MKRIFLVVGILAALFATSCKKDTSVTDKNNGGSESSDDATGTLIPYFDLGESLLGQSVSQAKSNLTSNGWQYSGMDDSSEPTEYTFSYKNETNATVQLSMLAYKNKNVVLSLSFKMGSWKSDSYFTKESPYLNLIKHVGQSYTMKSGKKYTFLEKDFSYDDLVSNFSSIFKRDFWRAMWQQGSSWDNGTILMYKYTNSFELSMEDNSYNN